MLEPQFPGSESGSLKGWGGGWGGLGELWLGRGRTRGEGQGATVSVLVEEDEEGLAGLTFTFILPGSRGGEPHKLMALGRLSSLFGGVWDA